MARLKRIEGLANDTISHYAHVKMLQRGLPNFVDSLLRGTVRFGRRTGNEISMLNPDNTYRLAESIENATIQITLETVPDWIGLNSILSLGPNRELVKVSDIIDNSVILEEPVIQSYDKDVSMVLLHSSPVYMSVSAANGDTEVIVKSKYRLANGDKFAYLLSQDLLQSLTEVQIENVVSLGTTTDPEFNLLYKLELSSPISRDLVSGIEVYIRAFPAYFSQSISIPNPVFTSNPMGPFLIDTLSGRLLEGKNATETMSIRTTNIGGDYIIGTSTEYLTVNKNYLIIDRPWHAHFPFFWELAEGTMRLSPNRLHARVNGDGLFCIGQKCVPNIDVLESKSWRLSCRATDDCTIRFGFLPQNYQEFTLPAGSNTPVIVTVDPSETVTDLEININSSSSTCEVEISDWTPTKFDADQIEYAIVAEVIGEATWQSTGLIIKPYFVGSELLGTNYDVGSTYDSGNIYL